MQSEGKKRNNGLAFLVMILCAIVAAVSSAGGLGEFAALVIFWGVLMAIYIALPG